MHQRVWGITSNHFKKNDPVKVRTVRALGYRRFLAVSNVFLEPKGIDVSQNSNI